LSAVPLLSARFRTRVAAKLIDLLVFVLPAAIFHELRRPA
jgi:hypothetical protein